MGAVVLGLALAGLIILAIFGRGRKQAKQQAATRTQPETKEERQQRERDEQQEQRRRDMVKFLTDPRLLK